MIGADELKRANFRVRRYNLNYTSNIGSQQQLFDATEAVALTSANGATKTGKSIALMSGTSNEGTSSVSAPDTASLSMNSVLMEQALSGSDVRAGKIGALQTLIATGTYYVSSSNVADKLISALLQ
jgi:flagellar biosynthesis anti-sigma factor FlgM